MVKSFFASFFPKKEDAYLPPCLLLLLLPLLMVSIPPLHDYPFHLARTAILAGMGDQYYVAISFLLPNVGMDVVMLGLARLLPIEVAGRVFLCLVLALGLSGTVALHRALHGGRGLWPLAAGFALYNFVFFLGFLNYLLGMGLALWAAAFWVWARPVGLRLAGGTVAAVGLLFCHLSALGVFALVVAGVELHRAWGSRSLGVLLASAGPFAVAGAALVLLSPAAGEAGQPLFWQAGWSWKPVMAVRMLMTPIPWLDAATLLPPAGFVALALWRGWLRLAPAMGVALGLLGVAYLAMPFGIFGSEWGDARLPPAILCVAIAGMRLDLPGRLVRPVVLAAVLLLAGRMGAIAAVWREDAARIEVVRAALERVPEGATLWVATAGPFPRVRERDAGQLARWHPPMKHLVSLAGLQRPVFVPATWADPFQQPMRVAPAFAAAKALQGDNPVLVPDAAALGAFVGRIGALGGRGDHLLLLSPALLTGELPAGVGVLAADAEFLLLRLP